MKYTCVFIVLFFASLSCTAGNEIDKAKKIEMAKKELTSSSNELAPEPFEVRTNSIGMEFVWIPPGEFLMGNHLTEVEMKNKYLSKMSDDGDGSMGWDYLKSEYPQHPVKLTKGFWIGRYEVTQEQYKKITGKTPSYFRFKCSHCSKFIDPSIIEKYQSNSAKEAAVQLKCSHCEKNIDPSKIKDGYSVSVRNHPVESVILSQAIEFCRKLGKKEGSNYTLPTEAQWEYCCRAGTKTSFYFGDNYDEIGKYAWYDGNSGESTHPVGHKKPNAWGLFDMHGNIEEWCLDFYDKKYYSKKIKIDPLNNTCPDMRFDIRVCRGGNFHDDFMCRSSSRCVGMNSARGVWDIIGFRVICFDLIKVKEEK